MKTPIDPSEPLFPIRPNEPVCQYYMKHGTCKFAQACKFHHPPQTTQHAVLNSGTVVMMNVGRQHESPQLVLNPISSDPANSSVMLQFLPQRPDEPDCIYFLKNGRCKYGATCRYHHPLNYHQRRAEEQRRHHEQRRNHYQPVHYVTQPVASIPQGHVYVADKPVALVNVEREATQGYQPFSIITGADGTSSYCVPIGSTVWTEQASSTSSIASSYDTAVDHVTLHGDGVNALWNRRSGSVNGLNVHNDVRGQARVILPHSASDGNIARRARASSHGSASDHSAFYEASAPNMRRNGSGSWRVERGSPFEHTQVMHGHVYGQRSDLSEAVKGGEIRAPVSRARPPGLGGGQARRSTRRGARAREGDEGFTMMTSALLNMLDTPEEVAAESYSDDDLHQTQSSYQEGLAHGLDPAMFERLSLNSVHSDGGYVPRPDAGDPSWSPSWQGAPPGRPLESNAQVMQIVHPRQQRGPPPASPHDPDVGLYLP